MQRFLNNSQREMLLPKLVAEEKLGRAQKATEVAMAKREGKNIAVKGVSAADRESLHRLALEAGKGENVITSYPFLKKASGAKLITMEEILAFETKGSKDALRKLVAEANERRKATMDADDHLSLAKKAKKSPEKLKTQKTLKIGKEGPAEIDITVTKSGGAAKKSASGKKRATSARSAKSGSSAVKSRKASAAKTASAAATRKAALLKKSSGKKATTAKASLKKEKSAAKSATVQSKKDAKPATTPTPIKPSVPGTPEKKKSAKTAAVKEELKSSGKKMTDKDFKKFLEEV